MKLLNKSILPVLLILGAFSLIVWRCTKHSDINTPEIKERLKYALQVAGKNRTELERVLAHYKNDLLKYKAAVFLIENMPGFASEEWGVFRKGTKDSLFSLKSFRNSSEAIGAMDSLHISFSLTAIKPDKHEIKSTFLINNIDKAFGLWNQPWARHLTFNDFCEYLLPYRVGREKLEDFRAYIDSSYGNLFKKAKKCSSAFDAACLINGCLLRDVRWRSQMALYPGSFSASEMSQMKIGDCNHLSNYGLMAFRSFGIPIANDFVTAWGDTNGGHSWTVLKLDRMEVPFVACDVQPGEFEFWYRPAKIWRKTFAIRESKLILYKSIQQAIPPELECQHTLDVTHKYFKTVNIDVELTNTVPNGDNCAFLCVYNNDRWLPIDWGKISDNQKTVRFSNVNDSLLYCVMYYNGAKLIPASQPFFSGEDLKTKSLTPNNAKLFNFKYNINSKEVGKEYSLFVWDGRWKKIATEIQKRENAAVLDFRNVPSGGLYKVNDKLRPFWFIDEKLNRSEPGKPFRKKKIN